MDHPPADAEARIFNVGDSRPVELMRMIEVLEQALGITAEKIFRPMQPGDVTATYADISRLNALTGYQPKVTLEEGDSEVRGVVSGVLRLTPGNLTPDHRFRSREHQLTETSSSAAES